MKRLLLPAILSACGGGEGAPGADLSGFPKARGLVGGVEFEVCVAKTPSQHAEGLMNATEAHLEPLLDGTPRETLFVFATEAVRSFWMKDTEVPMELAYARADGVVAEARPVGRDPRDLGRAGAVRPRALEGTFATHRIAPGAVIEVP